MAAAASPFGGTVAHGFLTLSLLPWFGEHAFAIDDVTMGVNYGLDRVRFPAPVKVNSRVRGRRELVSAELAAPNTIQLKQRMTVEIEGEPKPGCVAETLTRLVYA